jgi:hypothetical protein
MEQAKRLYRVKKFEPMFMTNEELREHYQRNIYNFICISGRLGGKSFNIFQLMGLTSLEKPQYDIVVLRANSSQLKQSVFLEMKKWYFETLPINIFMKIIFRNSPPLSITLPTGNTISFGGVGLGSKSGANQSRGKTTERKIALLVVEETQEIFSGSADGKELLQQAIATYVRFLDDVNGKIVYLGNRDRNVNGKFNVWCRDKERDETFLTIESNYHDIEPLLNDATLNMIKQEKELNPRNYQYMYLGIPVGGADLVYGAFTSQVHVMPKKGEETFVDTNTGKEYQFSREYLLKNCKRVYIGVDGSSTKDKCIFMPIFHFNDTKLICKLGDILEHDPKKNGQLTNHTIVNQYVRKWLFEIINKYGLQYTEKLFVVDGNNVDLIAQLTYQFGGYCRVIKFTKKDLVLTSDVVNDAFSTKTLLLTDESWNELLTNMEVIPFTLYNELETVCWREDDPTKFNVSIPNDKTDAIRYPVAYHANPYQLEDFSKGSETK